MSFHVEITGPAKRDMLSNHGWWSQNRSEEQADRWLVAIDVVIRGLADTANRHAFADETALRKAGIQQASFGMGRRPTHRILYRVEGAEVIVYRVRAFKQDVIGLEDLTGDAD